ncbi:hypothetical protein [Streptomyces apocyni]|uniref:hypothetical protein n=1 Tax=Streptomyces apocyni TaxID=2654677 RepID=UPI0018CFF7DB|nr:hypothetical protein [Streptomyces apocyni]
MRTTMVVVARQALTPVNVRLLDPPGLRRTISAVYRADEPNLAADTLRALLRGAFGRAGVS